MSRCIKLAKNGLGTSYPNPLVGSVLVIDDAIISEGFHLKAGQAHAEVNAINNAKKLHIDCAQLFEKATIYVNLEPCSHYGKTPPCADLIISSGIKKVVVGTTDPNPEVAGKGIQKLIAAGCDVIVGVLEDECNELNKRFFKFQKEKRPYITLKWAETQDGFIAPIAKQTQQPVWITNEMSRQLTHKLRSQEQAILVGTNTVMEDNPSLTTRDWAGINPTRILIDRSLKLPKTLSVFNNDTKTIVFTEFPQSPDQNIQFEVLDFSKNIVDQICHALYKNNIQSLIVEGGSTILQQFINTKTWDEAYVYKGTTRFFNKGVNAPKINGQVKKIQSLKKDLLTHYLNINV